jgi:type II secretory pathway pseudopilin PulG
MSKLEIKNLKLKAGFSLMEMIVYISIMALIMVVVVNTLIVIISTQRDIKNLRAIEQSAISAFDRIIREVRDANSVQSASSSLVLNSTDDLGTPITVEFSVNSGVLEFKTDNGTSSPLTNSQVTVVSSTFYHIIEGSDSTVKVEMTLEAGQGQFFRSENFYTSATFR